MRSIPACAGETRGRSGKRSRRRVDPRVRGGDDRIRPKIYADGGRSPRARGRPKAGISPLGQVGSIPACAGETTTTCCISTSAKVDPRVRGGDSRLRVAPPAPRGRSPRARGRRRRTTASGTRPRSIPACAGETASSAPRQPGAGVDPRVRGGDRCCCWYRSWSAGRSPRARGRPSSATRYRACAGSIPACAGETLDPNLLPQFGK